MGRKQLVRLIKSVSLSTAETKIWNTYVEPYTVLTPFTGSSISLCHHLFGDIPAIKNALTSTEGSYIGEKIHVKGVKFRFTAVYGQTVPQRQMWRFTLLSTSFPQDITPAASQQYSAATPALWFEGDAYNAALPTIRRRWNMDRVKVLKVKYARTNFDFTQTSVVYKNMWLKFNRTINKSANDNTVTNSDWGLNSGKQYYMVVDGYQMGGLALNQSGNAFSFSKQVYFKDS